MIKPRGAVVNSDKEMGVVKPNLGRRKLLASLGAGVVLGAAAGFTGGRLTAPTPPPIAEELNRVIAERKLELSHAKAALKTYVPGGWKDEFIMISSGGHGGQVLIIGVPSMRIIKVVAVFTPEPWQGYGYGDVKTMKLLQKGSNGIRLLTLGDTHHPEISKTRGEYDGEWAFIGDKLNARVASISLKDFETKDMVKIPNTQTQHGGACTTPNSEYVGCGSQFPAPWEPGKGYKPGVTYVKLTETNYVEKFRGTATFFAFDRARGIFDLARSFQIELPPYMQDLEVIGWGPSDGWAFMNSINTELHFGNVLEGKPSLEVGAAKNDFDYLHIINWKRAEELVRQGRAVEMNGIKVITLDVAAKEGVLFFAPEPKSPHGCDISPSGRYVVIGGKLAPVVTIYDVEKIKRAIADKRFAGEDRYGVPVLRFDDVKAAQIETNLGPLHNEFDPQGRGYVSTFIGNTVDRYTLGPPDYTGDKPFTKVGEIRIHYNIGHLCTPESNSVAPKGKYLVALNKWAVDRFNDVGPLVPQNFQLIDISGETMELLYDMPLPIGEPHYAKMILATKLKPLEIYSPVGLDPETFSPSPHATSKGKERIERKQEGGKWVTEVYGTLVRSTMTPDLIRVKQGDLVRLHLTNIETTKDATHAFSLSEYNVIASIEPGETATIEFLADKPGVYVFYCTEFCSPLHLEMAGWLEVEPQ
jgi:nitrous-oxide reductase